jgi:sulfate adenylyltransferase subunit 2
MAETDFLMTELTQPGVWDTETAFLHLLETEEVHTKRTAERRLVNLGFFPAKLSESSLTDENGEPLNKLILDGVLSAARAKRKLALFAQMAALPDGRLCLHANDARGGRYWAPLIGDTTSEEEVAKAFADIKDHIGKPVVFFPSGRLVGLCRNLPESVSVNLLAHRTVLDLSPQLSRRQQSAGITPHLKRLEAESIHILREAVAEAENPVMMYSVGKDSGVMLHLARKAFYPAPPPFPLLHVDTRWKFQEMYQFRDYMAREAGMSLQVYVNPQAIENDINPFDHGSALHTDITKTEGLKQALDLYRYDVIFGGARRDEEKSRAKERIFSFRTAAHRWDPKNQRPELWNLYNAKKTQGDSIRVFPLSNWTELDIWQYIYQENIPVVPLYFAKTRPVVVRKDMIMMVDDARCRLLPGEVVESKKVRFRTLGCYPLTGAVESSAETLEEIILELVNARDSERQGRKIDSDASASMEKKKQEGYF